MSQENSSIEVEAGTVEEAIKKALKQLKIKRDQAKIEVLSEEKRGLFGMPGARLAKVRVSMLKSQ